MGCIAKDQPCLDRIKNDCCLSILSLKNSVSSKAFNNIGSSPKYTLSYHSFLFPKNFPKIIDTTDVVNPLT